MKRFVFAVSILFSILLTGCICVSDKNDMVVEATIELEQYWENVYKTSDTGDGYFEIKNTRVIYIKDNDIEEFENIRCIIEFDIYTDSFGTSPYYCNTNAYNNVVVYDINGSMEIKSNVINAYRNKTFKTDYSDFIDSIVDYKDEYNCVKDLK